MAKRYRHPDSRRPPKRPRMSLRRFVEWMVGSGWRLDADWSARWKRIEARIRKRAVMPEPDRDATLP